MKNKPFKASIKDISAIQSNEQTKYQFTKTTNDTSKSIKNPNINFEPYKSKIQKNETAVVYPKNINEYVHLLKNHAFTQGDLDWTLELRDEKKKNGKFQKKYHLMHHHFMIMILNHMQEKQKCQQCQNHFYILIIHLN